MNNFFPSPGHKIIYGAVAFSFAYLIFEFLKNELFFLAALAAIGVVFMGLPSTVKSVNYQKRMLIGIPLAGFLLGVKFLMIGL